MAMRKSLLQWSGILVVVVLIFALGIEANEIKKPPLEDTEQRSDIITIDALKTFGPLERSEVIFLHDMHTEALEKNKKSCDACHLPESPEKDHLSLKFKRIKDTAKQEVMEIYHTECIGCHKETAASGEKAGPVEVCGQCHRKKAGVVSNRQPLSFDKSLHFRHTQAFVDKKTNKSDCGLCHHEYDEKAKKLFHAKEKEGSCRYCHMEVSEENRMSMRLASHWACLDCHKQKLTEKKETGPVKCSGCHALEKQQKIKKIESVPRIDRKQPDMVLIRADTEATEKEEQASRMNPVPFDHKSHEGYNETCIGCHHASLDSCSKKCHTVTGTKDGGHVSLERAMHQLGYEKSCLGCHDINQKKPVCAACHASMTKEIKADASCTLCHMKPVATTGVSDEILAERLLNARKISSATYEDKDIPDKVIIKDLSDKYEPVELPHRAIIKTLLDNMKDNKLAAYFHTEKGTICQGCHHNSPIDKKPPRCGSCHGKPFNKDTPTRPGLKAAYHQQCMECHKILNLEKPKATACIECHKEKVTATQVVR